MEVETHALSSFDLNSSPNNNFPATLQHSELRNTLDFRSSELLGYSDHAPVPEELISPVAGQDIGGDFNMASVSLSPDSASPAAEKLERCPSDAAMRLQKVYRSYRTRRMLADSAVVAEELW